MVHGASTQLGSADLAKDCTSANASARVHAATGMLRLKLLRQSSAN
jgi:hypothetical protein